MLDYLLDISHRCLFLFLFCSISMVSCTSYLDQDRTRNDWRYFFEHWMNVSLPFLFFSSERKEFELFVVSLSINRPDYWTYVSNHSFSLFVFSPPIYISCILFIVWNDSARGYHRVKVCSHFKTNCMDSFFCLFDRWTSREKISIRSVIMNIELIKTIPTKESIISMCIFRPDLDCGRFLRMTYSSPSIVSMCQTNR